MKINSLSALSLSALSLSSLSTLAALAFGALFACAVQAQDPQKPAADAKPAAATPQEAAAAPPPGPGQEPDPKIIEGIMGCLAEGLPQDWKRTWFVISEIARDRTATLRQFEGKFFYATNPADRKGRAFKPCGENRVIEGVIALNDYLQPSQKQWTSVTMTFSIEGKFDATYDYTVRKPAPAKPAAKPAPKKQQEAK